jgi:hypothetical protein
MRRYNRESGSRPESWNGIRMSVRSSATTPALCDAIGLWALIEKGRVTG